MEPVELLRGLVEIESLSGQEQAASAYLVDQMQVLGLDAHVDEVGNAVGLRAGDGEIAQEIVLLGHIDTVPGDIPIRVEDGILYGRGSVDAKGPLAAFVAAASQVDVLPGVRLVVIGAVEEESATSKGARYIAPQHRPACCIIGEPSGWNGVTLGYKGRLLVDYTLRQPMCHSAGAAAGAAEEAIAWWNVLSEHIAAYNQGRERLFDQVLAMLCDFNTHSDGLTNTVDIHVGLRLPPDFDAEAFEAIARQLAGEASLRCYGYEAAYQSNRQTELARAFNRALREMGEQPRFKLKTGTADMNVIGPIWNCPVVAYGPGDSRLDHTPEEHIVIDDYLKAIEVLKKTLLGIQDTIVERAMAGQTQSMNDVNR
ncbi:MAG: [LysW]-lysine hydrolase [Anaerolineae bacterium]|nr:[LysW]-lysine hydrolase [Anaerolineae bacterium]